MLVQPRTLIEEFLAQYSAVAKPSIELDCWPAPHRQRGLPLGKCAVYVFSLSQRLATTPLFEAGKVLKVGMAGPNSDARFRSQHYKPGRALSTLAGRLVSRRDLWPDLGIANITDATVGDWIKANTDRENFYLDGIYHKTALGLLEAFLIARLQPLFEGRQPS